MFAGGFTTGGTVVGLRIAAAYGAECYGLPTLHQASEQCYIAAQPINEYVVAMFHWPIAEHGQAAGT